MTIIIYDNDNDFLKDIDILINNDLKDICIYDIKKCNNCKKCIE